MDYEDANQLRREAAVRKSILTDFNKRLEDFVSEREYNDYLEWVEDLIARKLMAPEDESLRKEIEEYRKANADLIRRNDVMKKEADRSARERVAAEERGHQTLLASLRLADEAQEAEIKKMKDEEALDRMNLAAMDPVQRKKEKKRREKKLAAEKAAEEAARKAKQRAVDLSMPPAHILQIHQQPLPVVVTGHSASEPEIDDSVRSRAGGFDEVFQIERARRELVSSLFI